MWCVCLCYRLDFQSCLVLTSIEVNGSIAFLINELNQASMGHPQKFHCACYLKET